MRLMDALWVGLVVVMAIALFVLKYEVQGLEERVAERQTEIDKHARAIQVLEAEWTFLNDPARLRRLGLEYLELTPVEPSRFISVQDIPFPAKDEILNRVTDPLEGGRP